MDFTSRYHVAHTQKSGAQKLVLWPNGTKDQSNGTCTHEWLFNFISSHLHSICRPSSIFDVMCPSSTNRLKLLTLINAKTRESHACSRKRTEGSNYRLLKHMERLWHCSFSAYYTVFSAVAESSLLIWHHFDIHMHKPQDSRNKSQNK